MEEKELWFVDDDNVFKFIIEMYLQGTEYENRYTVFDDGDRTLMEIIGLAKKGEKFPKIIFLDLNMKYMDGWETLDFLNEMSRPLKVVIVTSSLSISDKDRAQREPLVVDYLMKPIDKTQLLDCIRLHLSTEGSFRDT
ncbi:MAG: hypothetical protein RL266_527 [Bacteroidota bacterium]|jgi:CheY-like chemotaxis protein